MDFLSRWESTVIAGLVSHTSSTTVILLVVNAIIKLSIVVQLILSIYFLDFCREFYYPPWLKLLLHFLLVLANYLLVR